MLSDIVSDQPTAWITPRCLLQQKVRKYLHDYSLISPKASLKTNENRLAVHPLRPLSNCISTKIKQIYSYDPNTGSGDYLGFV